MTGNRYCEILEQPIVPYFSRNRTMHYQHDEASSHYAVKARQILDSKLSGRWLGRRGPIEWPARSPDLTACYYWCWPYLKSLFFMNNRRFETLQSLLSAMSAIREKLNEIPLKVYRDTMRNFERRRCRDSGAMSLNDKHVSHVVSTCI